MEEQLGVIRLRVEHRVNPLGISTASPRLSWNLLSDRRGEIQTGYQIQVARDCTRLEYGEADLWDTGKIESNSPVLIPYIGTPLKSGERAWWRVRVWGADGIPSSYSAPHFWEMGLLSAQDWKASWISFPVDRAKAIHDGLTLLPCPFFRHTFALQSPIRRARLYASARGVYRLFCNGERVGSGELDPGWTDYGRRIQYQTYDVTAMLQSGENVLGAVIGEGWYSGYIGFRFQREHYGDHPELFAQLVVETEDGKTTVIGSNGEWKGSYGPLEYSDLLAGEYYDARRELAGWNTIAFDDSDWKPAHAEWTPPTAVPFVPQPDEPARVTQEVAPTKIAPLAEAGSYLVDMGQNMVGRIRLKLQGERGTHVEMRFAETVDGSGAIYTDNLRRARQKDTYILRGGGEPEVYEPLFTFHGFRYIEITGYPGTLTKDAIIGQVMESDTPKTGTLTTGHEMVNQLISNVEWGQRGNFLSVPTDCPQRDERLGWLGDAQVFVRTATYNRDVAAFFTKWMADVRDAQSPMGSFSNVAPLIQMQGDGAPAWGDAGVIVPWTLYQMYGDRRILEENYSAMSRWIAYLSDGNPDGIWRERASYNFSDWLSIEANTPADVLATAYFAYDCSLMARVAGVLGKYEDATKYRLLFEHIQSAFQKAFVSSDGRVQGETQTSYLLALFMDLLPEEMRAASAAHLVADIEKRNGHLSTGFIGVGYLCPVLTQMGYADVAYRLLLNETFPSWGYSIRQGATTIWERWDGWTEEKGFQDASMNSFNHYSLGSVGEWLYRFVAGIDTSANYMEEAGFAHFDLRPYPDARIGFVEASFLSPYGEIRSNWHLSEDDLLKFDVTIPAGTTATVFVPAMTPESVRENGESISDSNVLRFLGWEEGRAIYHVRSGRYEFRSRMPRPLIGKTG